MNAVPKAWTIYSASRHFGLHHKRLRALLADAGRLPAGHEALSANSVEIGGEDPGEFLAAVAETMSLVKAREYINAPRPHDRLLLDTGYIKPFIRGGTDQIKDHGVRRSELDRFLATLTSAATGPVVPGMHSILSAAKRADCSAMEIVRLIVGGELHHVALDPSDRGYMAMRVLPEEVGQRVRKPHHGCLTLREVERQSGWDTAVVKALVEQSLLVSQEAINPVKRAIQRVVHPLALADFDAKFVSLHNLARERNTHFSKLKQQLEIMAVQPAAGFDDVPATFYRRDQLGCLSPIGG